MKRICKIALACLLTVLLVVGGYVAYVLIDYERIPDNQRLRPELAVADMQAEVPTDTTLDLVSWNIGFGAYTADYSFFMDGGEYSRAFSEEAVKQNMAAIGAELHNCAADFYLVQEVDLDATRSYHVNELQIVKQYLPQLSSTFAINYDSPYLFWPLIKPHGKSKAGLATFSDYRITDALRRSLPIQDGFAKFVDLDRCYAINRIPTKDGKQLVLVNAHLSAYTSDPTIVDQQLEMLYADLLAEYEAGNYVICGGDFNKDLLGDSARYFGVDGEDYSWAKSFPFDSVPDGLRLVAPFDEKTPVPSCRNADRPWNPATNFQLTIDGFLVSDNVKTLHADVINTQFAYSDHNPVSLQFQLQQP